MNKERRKGLKTIMEQLEGLCNDLNGLLESEDECRENIPENLCGTEWYLNSEQASANMEDAISSVEDAIACIKDVVEEQF